MKTIFGIYIALFSIGVFAQNEASPTDSLKNYEGDVVTVYTKDYMKKYNRMKRLVVKVYPYALHAADIIDEIENNAESINRRGKRNRFFKQAYKDLKEDFKYFILDLYTSEGVMLMKLVHRETGMTVYDISSKYRGEAKANMFNLMAKIWDQDLHVEFEPDGDDKIAEQVIADIQSGLIPFNNEVVVVDKLEFRDKKKKEKELRKKNKENKKEYLKRKRKREKAKKKAARKKRKSE